MKVPNWERATLNEIDAFICYCADLDHIVYDDDGNLDIWFSPTQIDGHLRQLVEMLPVETSAELLGDRIIGSLWLTGKAEKMWFGECSIDEKDFEEAERIAISIALAKNYAEDFQG